MDEREAFTLAKLGSLEKLLEVLYVEYFKQFDEPIAKANEVAEAIRATETIQNQLPHNASLVLSESVNTFLDRVIGKLQEKGHKE